MIGGQHRRHSRCRSRSRSLEEVAERRGRAPAAGCTSRCPGCRSCGRHNRSPKGRWIEQVGRRRPRRAASRRAAPRARSSDRARRNRARRGSALRSPAVAGEAAGRRPASPRPGDRRSARLRASQTSGRSSARAARASASAIARIGRGDRRAARRAPAWLTKACAVPPPALVGIVAAHHHRRPVLAGDGDDPAARIGALHQVAERGHAQMIGRDGVIVASVLPGTRSSSAQ